MRDVDVARWRLRSQRLVPPYAASAGEAVGSLLAVQAENPGQAAWAVASRTQDPDQADLAGLLDDGAVLRTHVLRPTWHFVRAEDIGWLLDLTGPRVRRLTGQQLRIAHGLDERSVGQAVAAITQALATRGQLTRAQLADELSERGIGGSGQLLMILLAHAELDGLICSGRIVDGEHTYALISERVPATRRLGRAEALAELALRYFTGHGPATERDLAYWASLTLTDVRFGLQQVRDRLDSFRHDERTFWHAPGDAPGGPQQPAGHLLQILDETYRGYQDSRWVLDAAGDVPRTRETAAGMALVDAQLVAAMRRTIAHGYVQFDLRPYRPLTPQQIEALDQAATRYGKYLQLNARLWRQGSDASPRRHWPQSTRATNQPPRWTTVDPPPEQKNL
jgi:Winged helix DNA-binding domain